MTPKEKAIELFDKYDSFLYKEYNNLEAKKCALIAVDEILDVIDRDMNYQNVYSFYLNVKQEIKRL